MVRALLDGRKTQTRRVIKPQPAPDFIGATVNVDGLTSQPASLFGSDTHKALCRLLRPGDRLYVREAWHAARSLDNTPPRDIPRDADIEHAATARSYAEIGLKGKLRPGMFLPRWASRITLIVTDVRVQRLQEISEADAIAEGMPSDNWSDRAEFSGYFSPVEAFMALWDSLNAARGYGWNANPWVVAVTFAVERRNIDEGGIP